MQRKRPLHGSQSGPVKGELHGSQSGSYADVDPHKDKLLLEIPESTPEFDAAKEQEVCFDSELMQSLVGMQAAVQQACCSIEKLQSAIEVGPKVITEFDIGEGLHEVSDVDGSLEDSYDALGKCFNLVACDGAPAKGELNGSSLSGSYVDVDPCIDKLVPGLEFDPFSLPVATTAHKEDDNARPLQEVLSQIADLDRDLEKLKVKKRQFEAERSDLLAAECMFLST